MEVLLQICTVFHLMFPKRPCKIWAPYCGHCVEKNLPPTSKYVDPPNQAQKTVSVTPFQWCRSLRMFLFFLVRQGLISRSRAKSAFYGGSKTALSLFAK